MIPLLVLSMMYTNNESLLPALIFIIAAITDFFDGYLARSRNLVTTFGKFADPLADKMLVATAFIMLIPKVAPWMVVLVIMREFTISGLRILAASNGVTIAASYWGKFKTVSQFIAIVLLLLNNTIMVPLSIPLDKIFLYLSMILTVISLVDYFIKNIHVLDFENM